MQHLPLENLPVNHEADQVQRHTAWLREKLAKSAADTRPRVPHEQVMSEAQAIIDIAAVVHARRQWPPVR